MLIMKLFSNLIFILLVINCIEGTLDYESSEEKSSEEDSEESFEEEIVEIKMYSRSEEKYETWNSTNELDDIKEKLPNEVTGNNAFLKYNHNYEGIGKLSTPQECARTCTKKSLPKTCYYRFTIEFYKTLGGACDLCRPTTNTSLTSDCQCIETDGVEMSGIMVINRMLPGPSIQVCLGDLVIVDVTNEAPGAGVSIHWHGIYQRGWQYYDGTPYVTQCPISFGTSFRYKWRAQNVGTHLYHAHTGLHKPDGVEGAIVIRAPKSETPSAPYYDKDGIDNVIMIKDWFHDAAQDHWPGTSYRNYGQIPQNILINGKGQWFNSTSNSYTDSPLAVFNVKKNRRYRFRMINSLDWLCGARFTIQDHNVTIVATDGDDVEPLTVTTIGSLPAERYDFVLDTHHKVGTYWIQVRLLGVACKGKNISQVAILRYVESKNDMPKIDRPSYDPGLPLGIIFNDWNDTCTGRNPNTMCVQDLKSARDVNPRILAEKPDVAIFLPYNLHPLTYKELFAPNTYKKFEQPLGPMPFVGSLDNIINVFPTSPYLTQYDEIPTDTICNHAKIPKNCEPTKPCSCSHLIDIPLNSMVEVITIHSGKASFSHPFHLHGYGFHVMAQGSLHDVPLTKKNKDHALKLHRKKYGKSHNRPPIKDTVAVAGNAYTIVRFIADNPGFWLYHCHIQQHLLVGMSLTFRVGNQTHLPPKPQGFPECGNFLKL